MADIINRPWPLNVEHQLVEVSFDLPALTYRGADVVDLGVVRKTVWENKMRALYRKITNKTLCQIAEHAVTVREGKIIHGEEEEGGGDAA